MVGGCRTCFPRCFGIDEATWGLVSSLRGGVGIPRDGEVRSGAEAPRGSSGDWAGGRLEAASSGFGLGRLRRIILKQAQLCLHGYYYARFRLINLGFWVARVRSL